MILAPDPPGQAPRPLSRTSGAAVGPRSMPLRRSGDVSRQSLHFPAGLSGRSGRVDATMRLPQIPATRSLSSTPSRGALR
jgi:hypothetical protein